MAAVRRCWTSLSWWLHIVDSGAGALCLHTFPFSAKMRLWFSKTIAAQRNARLPLRKAVPVNWWCTPAHKPHGYRPARRTGEAHCRCARGVVNISGDCQWRNLDRARCRTVVVSCPAAMP
jgi:hypothetical protein